MTKIHALDLEAPAEEQKEERQVVELRQGNKEPSGRVGAPAGLGEKSGARIGDRLRGRDAAGKGGMIETNYRESEPACCFVWLPCPRRPTSEKSQMYMQRYLTLPAAGEIVIFDRGWYNRPGVDRIMGFCSEKKAQRFLELAPRFEAAIVESGIILLKYFLTVSEEEQERRFKRRIEDPLRRVEIEPDGCQILPQMVGLHPCL